MSNEERRIESAGGYYYAWITNNALYSAFIIPNSAFTYPIEYIPEKYYHPGMRFMPLWLMFF